MHRLVSAVKLSRGTSQCSCGHGRLVPPLQLVTLLFLRLLSRLLSPLSLPQTWSRRLVSHQELSTLSLALERLPVPPSPRIWILTRLHLLVPPLLAVKS